MTTSWRISSQSIPCTRLRHHSSIAPLWPAEPQSVSESFPTKMPHSLPKENASINVIYYIITANKNNHMLITRDTKKKIGKTNS